MKQRTITGFFIVLAVVLAVVSKFLPLNIGDYIFDIFIIAITMIAGFEMCNILDKMGHKVNKILTFMYLVFNYVILLICIDKLSFWLLPIIELGALLAYFLLIAVIELVENKEDRSLKNITKIAFNSVLVCLYPSFLFGLFTIINHMDIYVGVEHISVIFIAMVFAITMLSDTFAYLVGRTFKGPKLAPKISPNKTISGGVGGLIGGMAGAMIIYAIIANVSSLSVFLTMYNLNWWHFLLIGLFGSVISQCGDLFESFLKRKAEVKDSGNLLPGHGGMLDRIDAMTFCVAFLFIIILIILA